MPVAGTMGVGHPSPTKNNTIRTRTGPKTIPRKPDQKNQLPETRKTPLGLMRKRESGIEQKIIHQLKRQSGFGTGTARL